MRCAICDKKIKASEVCFGDVGTPYEGKPLCEECYYFDEPAATVYYGRDKFPRMISNTINETEGDFSVRWQSIDPWRGYYEVKSEKYSLLNSTELLASHESEKMLKNFDERLTRLFEDYGIEYARVFARSSNVFCMKYNVYAKKGQELIGRLLVEKAKAEVDYDNPKWYKNIVFDEEALNKLAELFPERQIKIDYDAVKLVEDLGDGAINELQKRLKEEKHGSKKVVKELVLKYVKDKPSRISLKLNWDDNRSVISIYGDSLKESVEYSQTIDFNSFAYAVVEAYEEVYGKLEVVPISFREEVYRNDKISLDLYPTGSAGIFDIFIKYNEKEGKCGFNL
jgi:hypothetical protein